MKQLIWLGSSRQDVRAFSAESRSEIGYALYRIQMGLEPQDCKSMSSVGSGVKEIRVHTGIECRVLYVAKLKEAVYILHAFEKKTRKTPKTDIELARKRFLGLMTHR